MMLCVHVCVCQCAARCCVFPRTCHDQTLEQLNELSLPLLSKLEAPLRTALARSGLPMSAISAVEIVGGGMRPRCVKRHVAEILGLPGFDDHTVGYGLSTTMNMDEAVAKGCAFNCAMLSPLFQVKEVHVTDYIMYPIKVSWDIKTGSSSSSGSADAMDDGEPEESKASSDTT